MPDALCVQSSPAQRDASFFRIQTRWYRAPEVYGQWPAYGPSIDVWSLGISVVELCGEKWHQQPDDQAQIKAVAARFCAPEASVVEAWPKWKKGLSASADEPWPGRVRELLGVVGADFLTSALRMDPALRLTVPSAKSHSYLHPRTCEGSGLVHAGARHEWCLIKGVMAAETLQWIRQDLADTTSLAIDFTAKRSHVKAEVGRKFILAGKMVDDPGTRQLCALSLAAFLPLPRLRSWFTAFKTVNRQVLATLQARAREATLQLLCCSETNAAEFLRTPLSSWFCSAAELAISDARGGWSEPLHQDGGASVIHMSITLFGARTLVCHASTSKTEDEQKHVKVHNFPGVVYLGGLTGPWHKVVHQDVPSDMLLQGKYSVTVQLRTSLFGQARARLRDTTPSPQEFFMTLASVIRDALRDLKWELPDHAACQQAYEASVASSSKLARAKPEAEDEAACKRPRP